MADTNTTTATIEPVPSSPATSTATDTPKFGQGGSQPTSGTTENFIREKFAELKGKSAKPAEPESHRARDGQFQKPPWKPAEKVVEQSNTPPEKGADAPAEKPVAETLDPKATEREERALTALRRAKVPKSILDGLDHDTRIQWGSDLAAEQSKTDKAFRSRGADTETRPDPKAGTPAQADPAQGTPQVAADLGAISAKFAETMALDEDGKKLLESYGAALRAPLIQETAAIRAEFSAHRQQTAQLDTMLSHMLAAQARTALVSEIPELGDGEVYKNSLTRMSRMIDGGGYDSITDPIQRVQECLRDAASIECRDAIRARGKDAIQNRNDKRAASQPVTGEKRSDPSAAIGDDPIRYAWSLLQTGRHTANEVQRLVEQRFG